MPSFLAKHWFLIVLALGVGSTLLWPGAMHHVTDQWEPRRTIAISLFLMAWTMPTQSLVAEMRHPYASLWAVFLSYGFVPLSAWLLGFLAPIPDVQIGLILVSTVPCTLSSAILWTRLAGGNEATALLTVMGTTFTSWFLTTALLSLLTSTPVELDATAMMLDLVLSLIVPVIAGQALRLIPACARIAERHKVILGVLAQGFVLAIVLKAGVTVGDKLHADDTWNAPTIFLWSILLAVALHLIALASGWFTCRWLGFDRGRQIAVAFSASQKTLQVSLVLYDQYFMTAFPFAVMPLLFYHVGQLLLDTLIARQMAKSQTVCKEAENNHGLHG
jgi:solute carrier family 10 (sodium/bile acid cotransporter), member 7